MSKVIEFPGRDEPEHVIYTEGDDGDLGVSMADHSLTVSCLNDSEVVVITPDGSNVFKRDELSKFIWIAAYFLDSEKRHHPTGKQIVRDY
jgi:hypothetical protein